MRYVSFLTLLALASCGGGGSGPTFADDHPRTYLSQNRERLAAALADGRPAATRFQSIVDIHLDGGNIYGFESWYAALLGAVTGEARYCEYAVGEVDAMVSEEEARIASGENAEVAADSYLYVGDRIGDVMLTYDYCFEHASNGQKARWLDYAAQAVWNVWNHEEAFWGNRTHPWSGWSTSDPSNNYYYSFLRATMLFGLVAHGEHPDAQGWLDFFRDDKIGGELVPTFEAELVGGGSREGTGYGTSMHRLWELYDLWEASTGESLADLGGHARASLLYYLHATAPTRDRKAPIGDHARDSSAAWFDYDRNYVGELSYLYRDDPLVPAAKTFLAESSVPEMDQPFMYIYDFLYEVPDVAPAPMDDLGTRWYGPGIGEVFARSSWATDATWLSFIAGPYTQSHAHRDQGSLMIYKEGWLAYDPVVDSTSGIRQEEELHNLVRLDGLEQRSGTESEVVALHGGPGWFHVAADLAPAYDGDVDKLERELVYLEPDVVVVFDRVTTASSVEQIWQLNAPARPTISGARATIDAGEHTLQVDRIAPASATATVFDWSTDGDFDGGYRLDVSVAGGERRMLHVLSVDGAASAVEPADADGKTGVTITFAGGATATVRFGNTAVDTTIETSGGLSETLGPGVDALPE